MWIVTLSFVIACCERTGSVSSFRLCVYATLSTCDHHCG